MRLEFSKGMDYQRNKVLEENFKDLVEQGQWTCNEVFVCYINMTWMPLIRKSGAQTPGPKFLNLYRYLE